MENIVKFVAAAYIATAFITAVIVISGLGPLYNLKANKLLEAQGKKWLVCGNYLIAPDRWKIVKNGGYYIVFSESSMKTEGFFKIYDIKNCRIVNHFPLTEEVSGHKENPGGAKSE